MRSASTPVRALRCRSQWLFALVLTLHAAARTTPIPPEPRCAAACRQYAHPVYAPCETEESRVRQEWASTHCSDSCRCKLANGTVTGYETPGRTDRFQRLLDREASIESRCHDNTHRPDISAEGDANGKRSRQSACSGLLVHALRAIQAASKPHPTRCALLFVGDSISVQAMMGAQCHLRDAGAERQLHSNLSARAILRRQPGFAKFTAWYAKRFRGWATDATELEEKVFQLPGGAGHPPTDILLARLQRAGSAERGPGVVGSKESPAPELFRNLVRELGSCTVVVYNEGLHHGSGLPSLEQQQAHFRSSVEYAMSSFASIARDVAAPSTVGPVFAAWEIVAQHFDTPARDGLYESRVGFNPRADHTLMSYYVSKTFKYSHATCVDTAANFTDWRNTFLLDAARKRNEIDWLEGFHQSSQAWGPLLHVQTGDCTHVWCYTPYFFADLWLELWRVVGERVRAHVG